MKFGLDIGTAGLHAHPRTIVELARDAEAAGWDGLFLFDGLLSRDAPDQPITEPWVTLGAIALATERLRIGPFVTPLPRRRPWTLARQTVTLDQLSNGRLVLGIGLGDMDADPYGKFGEETDPLRRRRLLDEGLDVLLGLWSGRPFSYQGEEYHIDDVTLLPPPVQQPR